MDGCFEYGKSGHKIRYFSLLVTKGRGGRQVQHSGSGSGARKQNKFYALQTRQEREGSADVVTGPDWSLSRFRTNLSCHGKGEIMFLMVYRCRDPTLKSIPIINEFPEVFPDDLPGIPPEREIDFGIDLLIDTQNIPYGPDKT
ncbi:hypothetical protein MTR67_030345 [Solanum verrucosum]|uniref:Reverse transcriptase domain-containing protein n=1 Tax=Solanum verrucosum TaxID=315347 RepID=A0AAF0RCJ2_SOLVR|nr:hypothetical protein MTR67_030345 [Solanum verrucosum]